MSARPMKFRFDKKRNRNVPINGRTLANLDVESHLSSIQSKYEAVRNFARLIASASTFSQLEDIQRQIITTSILDDMDRMVLINNVIDRRYSELKQEAGRAA